MPINKNLVKIVLDNIFTDTRIQCCDAVNCRYHSRNELNCNFKAVILHNGKCIYSEEIKKDDADNS